MASIDGPEETPGKGSSDDKEGSKRESVDVKKVTKEIKEVIISQYVNITSMSKKSLRPVADGMYHAKIISRGVNDEPTYNSIIHEFDSSLGCFATLAKVEDHCKKFLSALESVGGDPANKAATLREEWVQAVKTKFGFELDI